jgi:tetratricopeptide (TPR) repeat protein
MLAGDIPEAHRYLEDAYTVAKEAGDEFGLAEYHMNACVISGFGGDLEASVRHDEETARQGEALGVDEIRVEGLVRLAENAIWLMDFDKAEQALREAITAAEQSDDLIRLALVHVMGSTRMRLRDGDTESALQILLENTETLNRYPSFYTPLAMTFMGTLSYDRGDIEGGVSVVSETHRDAIAQQSNFYIAVTSAALVRMYGVLHLTERLQELRSAALEAVQAPLGNYLASTVWADLGYANLAMNHVDSAGDDFANGLAAVSATQYWEKPRLLIGSALVAIETGDLAKAQRLLDEVQAFLLEKELRLFDGALGHARGKLLLAESRYDEALEKLTGAFESATTAGLRPLAAQIAVTAATVAAATGDGDVARRNEETARSLVGEMAGAIIDDELRAAVETVWLEPLDQLTTG